MRPFECFSFCPKCGSKEGSPGRIPFHCRECGFKLFFNPAVSVSAFIFDSDQKLLLIRRAKEPAKDKLSTIGGFVDYGEDAETALHREIREEIGVKVVGVQYLSSSVNSYDYQGVVYPVLDLFFTATLAPDALPSCSMEVSEIINISPLDVDAEDLSFASVKVAFNCLKMNKSKIF